MSNGASPTVQQMGQDGCCPCSDQDGCQCNEGSNCIWSCRSRTSADGLASFCGYAEYLVSDPPNYYLTKNLNGSISAVCGNPVCAGMTCEQNYSYAGQNSIDVKTCVETKGATLTCLGCCPCVQTPVEDLSGPALGGVACGIGVEWGFAQVFTATTNTISPASTSCTPNEQGTGACQAGGVCQAQLGGQETYEDAIDRAVDDRPWTGGPDCTKAFSSTTELLAGQRTFAFQQAQFMVGVGVPIPGHTYLCILTLGEHAVNSDAGLVPFANVEVTITAPPSGPCVSGWIDIPNIPGLVILPYKCTYTDTSA